MCHAGSKTEAAPHPSRATTTDTQTQYIQTQITDNKTLQQTWHGQEHSTCDQNAQLSKAHTCTSNCQLMHVGGNSSGGGGESQLQIKRSAMLAQVSNISNCKYKGILGGNTSTIARNKSLSLYIHTRQHQHYASI
jgi:hypothetical protein